MEPLGKRQKNDRWSDAETRFLLSAYESFVRCMDGTVRDTEWYKRMVKMLSEFGVERSLDQIRNKIKFLRKRYKETKETGESSTFSYYEEMDRIMSLHANYAVSEIEENTSDQLFSEEPTVDASPVVVLLKTPKSPEKGKKAEKEEPGASISLPCKRKSEENCVVLQVSNQDRQQTTDNSLEESMGTVIGKLLKRVPEPRKSRLFRNFVNALCTEP